MHDLDITVSGLPTAAMEVTAAADSESIALWKLVNGGTGRWIEERLTGGWSIQLLPSTRAKRLRRELPALLLALERADVREVDLTQTWRPLTDPTLVALKALGLVRASRYGTDFPGSIYLTVERPDHSSTAMADASLTSISIWIATFLAAPVRRDVLDKLRRSGASERHVFVILPGFNIAPFDVFNVPWGADRYFTDEEVRLPPEVTHVWLASTWSIGTGMRWSPASGWAWFATSSSTV